MIEVGQSLYSMLANKDTVKQILKEPYYNASQVPHLAMLEVLKMVDILEGLCFSFRKWSQGV